MDMEYELSQLPEEWTLGGRPGQGLPPSQDVTIILIPNGGCKDQKLALIHLHSNILSNHSKYFNACLSDRWTKSTSRSDVSLEFVLEVQADVAFYFDCFSSMYSPFLKNFQGAKYGLELLRVASQIIYEELMEHISLNLSNISWSAEEEIRIREYSSSPDFPRKHADELVARLGLDESEEDCHGQLCDLIQQYIHTALLEPDCTWKSYYLRAFFRELLQSKFGHSNFSRTVVMIVSREAKDMFNHIGQAWDGKSPTYITPTTIQRLEAMSWVLEALLLAQAAEELVQGIVHLAAIPNYISEIYDCAILQKVAKVVLRIYQEVVDGHLLLRTPERIALLANWHSIVTTSNLRKEDFDQVTKKLFLTLPLRQQLELINLQKEYFDDYISPSSLVSMLSKQSWPDRYLGLDVLKQETVWWMDE